MKKKIFLQFNNEDYVTFRDVKNNDEIYCMTREMLEEKKQKMRNYKRESEVPDDLTIKSFRVGKVGERDIYTDNYDITSKEFIDFPINRIDWMWIELKPNQE